MEILHRGAAGERNPVRPALKQALSRAILVLGFRDSSVARHIIDNCAERFKFLRQFLICDLCAHEKDAQILDAFEGRNCLRNFRGKIFLGHCVDAQVKFLEPGRSSGTHSSDTQIAKGADIIESF